MNMKHKFSVGDYVKYRSYICRIVRIDEDLKHPRPCDYVKYSLIVMVQMSFCQDNTYEVGTELWMYSDEYELMKQTSVITLLEVCQLRAALDDLARCMAECTSEIPLVDSKL